MNIRSVKAAIHKQSLPDWVVAGVNLSDGSQVIEPLWGGSLDTDDSDFDAGVIKVQARSDGGGLTNTKNVEFAIRRVLGKAPKFHYAVWDCDDNPSFPAGQTATWSYDGKTWYNFQRNIPSALGVEFSNVMPFERDTVYVSVYPAKMLQRFVDYMRCRWLKHPAVSGTASEAEPGTFVVTSTPAKTADAAVGRNRPAQPLYGFKVSFPGKTPTKLGVFTAAVHSAGEGGARWWLQGAMDYLLYSEEAKADVIRENMAFLVYPQLNPLGEICGTSRGYGDATSTDPNRTWDGDPSPMDYHTDLMSIWPADIAAMGLGAPRIMCDSHQWQAAVHFLTLRNGVGTPGAAFFALWQNYYPASGVNTFDPDTAGTVFWWWENELDPAPYLPTMHEVANNRTFADIYAMGENYMRTISDAITAEVL